MRLARVVVATVVGIAGLAGCSDGGQASETLPPTSTSASAEPSQALTPLGPPDLPMPAEAREMTPAGAEAFLRYYVDLMNRAQIDQDANYVQNLSADCSTCEAFTKGIDAYAAEGYRYDGGQIALRAVSAPAIKGGEAEFSISIVQESLQILVPSG